MLHRGYLLCSWIYKIFHDSYMYLYKEICYIFNCIVGSLYVTYIPYVIPIISNIDYCAMYVTYIVLHTVRYIEPTCSTHRMVHNVHMCIACRIYIKQIRYVICRLQTFFVIFCNSTANLKSTRGFHPPDVIKIKFL